MGAERGESRPQSETDSTDLYDQALNSLPLNGTRPEYIVLGKDGGKYLVTKDASKHTRLSAPRIRDLVSAKRLEAKKLDGLTNLMPIDALNDYIHHGRKKPGRPRKNP